MVTTFFNKLFFIVVLLFIIALPLPIGFISTVVILLFIFFLLDIKNFNANLNSYIKQRGNILLLVIFLSLLISVIYSDDKQTAMKGILAALPLVALPLSLQRMSSLSSKQYITLKSAFIITCFVASIAYFFIALSKSGLIDGSYPLSMRNMPLSDKMAYVAIHLTYHHLSPSIHAVFFSLYVAFAILLLFFEWKYFGKWLKLISGFIIFYLTIYLILLESIIINFGLYSFIIIHLYLRFSFKKWLHYFLFVGSIVTATFITCYLVISKSYIPPEIAIYRFDSSHINKMLVIILPASFFIGLLAILIKQVFSKKYLLITGILVVLIGLSAYLVYNQYEKDKNPNVNNIAARISYSKEAIRVIKTNPVLGIGIGDKKNDHIMKTQDLPEGALPGHIFNSHNQFLDFWLASGIVSLLCFVFFLFNEFRKSLRQTYFPYIGLVYIFSLFCFTDTAIMIQRGQLFFLFFIILFQNELRIKGFNKSHL